MVRLPPIHSAPSVVRGCATAVRCPNRAEIGDLRRSHGALIDPVGPRPGDRSFKDPRQKKKGRR